MTYRVTFVTTILTHYRVEFHKKLREKLAASDVQYELIYSDPFGAAAQKRDTADIDWATKVPIRSLDVGRKSFVWQAVGSLPYNSDLTIIGYEAKLVHNLPLMAARYFGKIPRVAFFGHGRNFQSRSPGAIESFKRWLAALPDWWFCYTTLSADAVLSSGFPRERITVFENTIDTQQLQSDLDSVSEADVASLRAQLGMQFDQMALFIGGLHDDKRLDFLVAAADLIKKRIPDFELVVAGDGPSRRSLELLSECRPWMKILGPVFGPSKAALLRQAKLILMPGLVGLVVIDSFAAGVPLVTTSYPYHSPEISYLREQENGVVVNPHDSIELYSEAVCRLLLDESELSRLARNAATTGRLLTIDNMVERFAAGVLQAIKA